MRGCVKRCQVWLYKVCGTAFRTYKIEVWSFYREKKYEVASSGTIISVSIFLLEVLIFYIFIKNVEKSDKSVKKSVHIYTIYNLYNFSIFLSVNSIHPKRRCLKRLGVTIAADKTIKKSVQVIYIYMCTLFLIKLLDFLILWTKS